MLFGFVCFCVAFNALGVCLCFCVFMYGVYGFRDWVSG